MMRHGVNAKNVFFILRLTALSYVVFFTGSFFWGEFLQFFVNKPLSGTPDIMVRIPQRPIAQATPPDMVVYDRREDTLVKRDELIYGQRDFLFADLDAMMLAIYQKGKLAKTFSIVAKGPIGTFFEIPNGFSTVQFKEETHASLIEDISMPWTVGFADNYMIHGVGFGANGVPLETPVTNGGIRLAMKDAKEIFTFARMEMPVVVLAKGGQKQADTFYFHKIPIAASKRADLSGSVRGLSAASAFAADIETGEVFFEKQKDVARPIASVTKLMTALVALDSVDPAQRLVINEQAVNTLGDTGRLRLGDVFQAKDLLYPLLLSSSNDAATVYAQHLDDFVERMNQKAKAMGLTQTIYKDPTGLTPKNVSTAQDLFMLISHMYRHEKEILDISRLPEYAVAVDNKLHAWRNNTWPDNNGVFLGGKFGFTTEAKQTLAAVFGITMSEFSARPIAIVLLGSNDRRRDVAAITNHIRNRFAYGMLLEEKNTPPLSQNIHLGVNIFEVMRK
ncbi:MAG: serine hydrolase [Patescibacteria group bacterium]